MKQVAVRLVATTSVAIAVVGLGSTASQAKERHLAPARLVVVQALPKQALAVSIDGRSVSQSSSEGSVLGPFDVSAGQHRVRFTNASGSVRLESIVDVKPGASSDVVVHTPAAVGGAPVVNSYRTPMKPIAPGKARVLIAHTATVAPADVVVDGKVVFHDIANGEFATADVAAGTHRVALLPAGLSHPALLGPLKATLAEGTVTMVYAVGNPKVNSMNVIVHHARLQSSGAMAPSSIDTGRAGLAAGLPVTTFTAGSQDTAVTAAESDQSQEASVLAVTLLLVAGGAMVVVAARPRHRRRSRRP